MDVKIYAGERSVVLFTASIRVYILQRFRTQVLSLPTILILFI